MIGIIRSLNNYECNTSHDYQLFFNREKLPPRPQGQRSEPETQGVRLKIQLTLPLLCCFLHKFYLNSKLFLHYTEPQWRTHSFITIVASFGLMAMKGVFMMFFALDCTMLANDPSPVFQTGNLQSEQAEIPDDVFNVT